MSQVQKSISIDASPQAVFDVVMDPERLGDWVTIHRSVEVTSNDPRVEGATMNQKLALHGVSVTVHWTLAHVQAPHDAEWHGKGPAGSTARIQYRIGGEADGPTTFEYTNEFSAPGGVAGQAAAKVVVGGASEQEAEKSLQRLKTLMEG